MEPREPGWEHEVSHPPSFLLHNAPTFLVRLTISDAWGGDEGQGEGRVAERAITVIFFDSLKKPPQHRCSGGQHWSFQHGHVVLWKLLFSVWLGHQLGQDSNTLTPWVGCVGCGKSSALGILPPGFFKCRKVSEVSAGRDRLLQTGNWEAWKSKFPRYFPLTGVGCCCWWVHTQLSGCQLMSAWPFPLELSAACAEWGQWGLQIPKDRMFAPRSKPDSVLSLLSHFFAFLLSSLWKQELLNGMPLQADEKAVFLPQWMFTQERQLEGERLSGRAGDGGGGAWWSVQLEDCVVLPMSNSGLFLINYHV